MRLFFLALRLLCEWGKPFYSKILFLSPLADLSTFIDDFCEFVDFLDRPPVTFFKLLDDFERTMFFAENSIEMLSVDSFFNFHEVVCTSCALYVKWNHAFAVLALDASAAIFFATNDTLKTEALLVNLTHSHRCLWSHDRTWGPKRAGKMHPLVQRLCMLNQSRLQHFFISLQKEYVVFRNLSEHFGLQKMQVNQILGEVFAI